MRYLTLAALAVAATLSATGVARAVDEPSLNAADAAAAAAAQASPRQPLGYAASRVHDGAFASVDRATSQLSEADRAFLAQGDRGIGNN